MGRQPVHAGEGVNKRVLMGTLHPPTQPTWGQIHLVIIAEVKQVGHDGLQGHVALSLLPPGHLWFNTIPSASPIQGRLGLLVEDMDIPYSHRCRYSHCW